MAGAQEQSQETRDLMSGVEQDARNGISQVGLAMNPVTPTHILCHPKTDPLKVLPSKTVDMCGFKFERVKSCHRVQPGGSYKFDIPNKGTQHWSYANSVHARLNQSAVQSTDKDVPPTVVYCFRVWGDMIHSKDPTYTASTAGQYDFQTGSTSLTFATQRVMWARSRPRYFTTINPVLQDFDAVVELANQEMINDEEDKPMTVAIVGDSVIA